MGKYQLLINDIIHKANEIEVPYISQNKHNKEVFGMIKINLDKYFNLYIIELDKDTKSALCLISAYEIQIGYFDLNHILNNCPIAKIDNTFVPTCIHQISKDEKRKSKFNF